MKKTIGSGDANVVKLRSVYDLAAFCYDYLVDKVDDQEYFIGKYVLINEESSVVNPNIAQLNAFSSQVKRQFLKNDSDSQHEALPFEKCIGAVRNAATKIESGLKAYGDDLLNRATIPLYILYAK